MTALKQFFKWLFWDERGGGRGVKLYTDYQVILINQEHPYFFLAEKSAFKLLVFFSPETTVFHDGCHSEQRAKSVYIIKRKLILYHTKYTHDVLISIIQLNSFKIDGITSSPVVRFYTFLTLLF